MLLTYAVGAPHRSIGRCASIGVRPQRDAPLHPCKYCFSRAFQYCYNLLLVDAAGLAGDLSLNYLLVHVAVRAA